MSAAAAAAASVAAPGSLLVTGIGELVTCAGSDGAAPVDDRTLPAEDRLGIRRGAAVLVEDGRVAWVGDAGRAPAADRRVDLGGRAVVPGFVDSHSPPVCRFDRRFFRSYSVNSSGLRPWRYMNL